MGIPRSPLKTLPSVFFTPYGLMHGKIFQKRQNEHVRREIQRKCERHVARFKCAVKPQKTRAVGVVGLPQDERHAAVYGGDRRADHAEKHHVHGVDARRFQPADDREQQNIGVLKDKPGDLVLGVVTLIVSVIEAVTGTNLFTGMPL